MIVAAVATRALVFAATLLVTPVLAGAGDAHDAHRRPAAADPRRGASLYEIGAGFVDQHGRRVGLDVARGHPVLVTMLYASCRDACPLLIAAVQRIERAVPPDVRATLHVVLVTLDPVNDRPAVLRELAAVHGTDTRRWHFLTGSEDAVRDVAAVLGIKFRRLSTGAISHSSVITLLDAAGAIRERTNAFEGSPDRIVERLVGGHEARGAHAGH